MAEENERRGTTTGASRPAGASSAAGTSGTSNATGSTSAVGAVGYARDRGTEEDEATMGTAGAAAGTVYAPHRGTREDEELNALITECMADVERAREKMGKDQLEIDRLKSETRMMIARLLVG